MSAKSKKELRSKGPEPSAKEILNHIEALREVEARLDGISDSIEDMWSRSNDPDVAGLLKCSFDLRALQDRVRGRIRHRLTAAFGYTVRKDKNGSR
ncbi:MAG: hypothetical protein GF400_09705 [Candidatus Eisenbacteria bacterium]|nr:hypothetical protein [Candidatus Eisenbacteria bacterium]